MGEGKLLLNLQQKVVEEIGYRGQKAQYGIRNWRHCIYLKVQMNQINT